MVDFVDFDLIDRIVGVGTYHPQAIGAIGALMNRVLQPRPLVVLGLNVWMGTAAGADELVEIPYREFCPGPRRTPFFFRRVLDIKGA